MAPASELFPGGKRAVEYVRDAETIGGWYYRNIMLDWALVEDSGLKSRTIYDSMIDRFGLMERYEAQYKADARNRLDKTVTVKSEKISSLFITWHCNYYISYWYYSM